MKSGTVKRKAVTSGRLTGGGVKLQPGRRRVAPNPGPVAAGPEPAGPEAAYSLYSTDSEDQVTTLHKGLDRCAALLADLLQAESTEAASGAPKAAAAKSKSAASLGKKSNKKPPTKTDQKNSPCVRRAAGGATPRTPRPFRSPAAHSGVTLHPPQKRAGVSGSSVPGEASADGEQVDFIPVRDTTKASEPRPGPAEEEEAKLRTVQDLLGELKALIIGQERLLSHLEQTVSSPPVTFIGSESLGDLQSLHTENKQLRGRVNILNQQLKAREEAERQQTLCDQRASTLQQELTSAQDDLAEAGAALQDTRSRLRDEEAENARMKADLESTRSRLLHSEQEKSELASLVQRRLEEIERLNRILQQQHSRGPPSPATDHIAHYLMSLDALRDGNAAAEKRRGETPPLPERLSPDEKPAKERRRRLFDVALSRCDVESVTSDWSVTSASSFNTRDEAAFRDGLAALDASIASLQKTIKVDLDSGSM